MNKSINCQFKDLTPILSAGVIILSILLYSLRVEWAMRVILMGWFFTGLQKDGVEKYLCKNVENVA